MRSHSYGNRGTDYIDIYGPARADPALPIKGTVG
jgi:aryl-alcohol dehydrogenase-like predicted oxidoreductase